MVLLELIEHGFHLLYWWLIGVYIIWIMANILYSGLAQDVQPVGNFSCG
ncbi:hypothetical protein NEIELOOT_01967 [Neisseria elongata subsp. glycolytica ATCC 29315]|uniref:Uncharacterized protein n=1 Tax=Neisseria elongata subsp. glycolytica ATCC 29315 TaxID=546263 RepID=D4DSC3_NEIEG|nr:hypothetical protein NEIELOOT_01967 [Neisseria elongata subsp. glycolytica ATCC 29315]